MGAQSIETCYAEARERFASLGVDSDAAISSLSGVAISLHCWQGDDIAGFEGAGNELGGDLQLQATIPAKLLRRTNFDPISTWPIR